MCTCRWDDLEPPSLPSSTPSPALDHCVHQVEPGALVQNQLLFLYVTLIPGRGVGGLIKATFQASGELGHRFLASI